MAIRVDATARSAEVDFTGTSLQQTNNFNAPTAVCMAAVLYVFRTLVNDDIPLNAGCLKPIKVIIPAGSMLNPNPPRVGGGGQCGNVELHHQCAVWRAGRDGGQPVLPGINRVVRVDGSAEDLGHISQAEMQAGDVFEIHTPGGGGFGVP